MTVAVEAASFNKPRSNQSIDNILCTPTYSNHRQSHKTLCSRHICTIGAPHSLDNVMIVIIFGMSICPDGATEEI
jgi:hypothetical protein